MDFDLVSQTKCRTNVKTGRASIRNMELKSTRSSKPTASFTNSHSIKLPGSSCLHQYLIEAEKRKNMRYGGSIRKSSLAVGISKCTSQEMSRDNLIEAENRSIAAVTKNLSQSNEHGHVFANNSQLVLAHSASCLVEQNESNFNAQEENSMTFDNKKGSVGPLKSKKNSVSPYKSKMPNQFKTNRKSGASPGMIIQVCANQK